MTEGMLRVSRGLLAFTLTLAPMAPVAAQQADSLPFRKGQWGAEFSAGNFSGLGALRFTKPNTAWLIDVQGSFSRESGSSDQTITPGVFRLETDSDALQLRLGWRRYAPVASRVVRHAGLGVLASRFSSDQRPAGFAATPPISYTASRTGYAAGVFGELGAQWMITPNLGLGATWSASLTAGSTTTESFTAPTFETATRVKNTTNTFTGSLGSFGIRGAVYF